MNRNDTNPLYLESARAKAPTQIKRRSHHQSGRLLRRPVAGFCAAVDSTRCPVAAVQDRIETHVELAEFAAGNLRDLHLEHDLLGSADLQEVDHLARAVLTALALDIDPAFVATHHLVRIFLIILVAPLIFRLWQDKKETRS